MSIERSRELSHVRKQRLCTIRGALIVKEQEIEREIVTMSQTSTDTVSLSHDSLSAGEPSGNQRRRRMEFSSEDESESLSKYRKLTTGEKIIESKREKNSDTSSYESEEESSNDGEQNQKEENILHNNDNLPENACSSNDYNHDNVNNETISVQYRKQLLERETESESDVDSYGNSQQNELTNSEVLETSQEISTEALKKYIIASTASKVHNQIVHTSQFSCNNDDSANGNKSSLDVPARTLKQSNSDMYENTDVENGDTECIDTENKETKNVETKNIDSENVETKNLETENVAAEDTDSEKLIGQTEVPSSSANEIVIAENSNDNQTNLNDDEQEAAIQNLLTNAQFSIIREPTSDNPNYVLKKNDSDSMDSQVVSEVTIPEHVNEIYVEHGGSSNVHTSEHSYQVPSTSGVVEEQNITEESRASSVSDLNLAQLVLSLRQDIQELSKKVENQGTILDAVVHANEINIGPLFAQSFPEKYNLQLPFTRIEDFDKFNQDLARNTKFCNEFITSLCSYIDNNVTLAKNILTMLRKYMSRDLAMLYTASKATGNKMVLKDTLFCKCLLQATKLTIRNGLLPLEHEKAFMKNLGIVVSGAKGWHTHDEERRNSNSQR